jgi:hypothetical protein
MYYCPTIHTVPQLPFPKAKGYPYVLGTSYSSILTNLSSQTTSCPARALSLFFEGDSHRPPLPGRINSIILTLRKPILHTSIMRQHNAERHGLIILCTRTYHYSVCAWTSISRSRQIQTLRQETRDKVFRHARKMKSWDCRRGGTQLQTAYLHSFSSFSRPLPNSVLEFEV